MDEPDDERLGAKVLRFPRRPLAQTAAPTEPPTLGIDARQARAKDIIGGVTAQLTGAARTAGPNFSTGYFASAVDVGKVQAALEHGLARVTDETFAERWEEEVAPWIHTVIMRWIQRVKQIRLDRSDEGIRIEIETQDDLGCYGYRFDLLPRRGSPTTAPR